MTTAQVIRAPAGLGKTTLVLQALAREDSGPTEIYVPTHALAAEVGQKLRNENSDVTSKVIGGRGQLGANGEPLCKKHVAAEEIAQAGGDVLASLCGQSRSTTEERCELYAKCPYIAQFGAAQVTIYPHAYLPLNRMQLESGVPELAIIDEAFFGSCIERSKVPAAILRAKFLGPTSSLLCAEIERALTEGRPLIQHLFSVGDPVENCQAALAEIRKGAPRMFPSMSDIDRRMAATLLAPQTQVSRLIGALHHELLLGRADSHALRYCPKDEAIFVHWKRPITRFRDHQGNEARVLVIDANADDQLVSRLLKFDL